MKKITLQWKKHLHNKKNIVSMAHKTENQPFLRQFYIIFRITHEHIFYITIFGMSYTFHICPNFEQHFSGSRDFVQDVKHAFYAQTTSEADRSRVTTLQPNIDL